MSSLWTPGGEVPVDRSRTGSTPPAPDTPPTEDELAAQAAELQRFLLQAPAEEIVAQHAMGLYELAVIHLSQPEPRLPDARLAIDALAALVDGLHGRLGDTGDQLRQALPQLQMAFVQLADRSAGHDTGTERAEG
jgi:hypothetical protein